MAPVTSKDNVTAKVTKTPTYRERKFPDGTLCDVKASTGKVLPRPYAVQSVAAIDVSTNKTIGKCVSDRHWKRKQPRRSSAAGRKKVANSKALWEKKQAANKLRKQMKTLENEIKEKKRLKRVAERERRAEQEKRRKLNELKNSSYQTITNVEKIKKMSKKQLKRIKKTRVNADGSVEIVGIYE